MKVVVVAGTSSGVGKTCLSIGLMAAYRRRGLRVQPFKVGPDFLDPMHHKAATGRDSINLDGWMLSREANVASFKRCARDTDIAIVEGVMGLFDGRDGKSERGSTSEMAKFLGAPVVLVLDCWALARSAAAMIHGFTTFDRDLSFAGVVFNKVGGPAHSAWLREAVEGANVGVTVLGGVPRTPGINIPERHLGLHMPDDQGISADYIARLADLMELHVDLDAILQLAATDQGLRALPPVPNSYHHHHHHHQNHVHHHDPSQNHHHNHHNHHEQPQQPQQQMITLQTHQQTVGALNSQRRSVRIGVAKDAAFCFYYHENLALLEDAGAELVFFSPLKDPLPGQLDAIYFGGGYPELHAEELSQNTRLMYAVRAFATVGGIIYAECGGLMYLSQGIQTKDGEKFALCGVLPFWTRMVQRMVMGYVKVTLHEGCMLFPPDLKELRGHVYHFSEIADDMSSIDNSLMGHDSGALHYGYSMELQYPGAMVEQEGYQIGNVLASYVHLHFGSNPACAHFFVERCRVAGVKAAAVAAASAAAVADAGPVAAAAAGAAAAEAVTAALGLPKGIALYAGGGGMNSQPVVSEIEGFNKHENRGNGIISPPPPFVEELKEDHRRLMQTPWSEKGRAPGTMDVSSSMVSSYPWDWVKNEHVGTLTRPELDNWNNRGRPERLRNGVVGAAAGSLMHSASDNWDMSTISGEEQRNNEWRSRSDSNYVRRRERNVSRCSSGTWSDYGRDQELALREDDGSRNRGNGTDSSYEEMGSPERNRQREREERAVMTEEQCVRNVYRSTSLDSNGHIGSRDMDFSEHVREREAGDDDETETLSSWDFGDGESPIMHGAAEGRGGLGSAGSRQMSQDAPVRYPSQIVSLLPSATEILMELGVGDRLVGVSDLCDYPADVSSDRHIVSRSKIDTSVMSSKEVEEAMKNIMAKKESFFELDVEWLESQQPDLILTQDSCARCDVTDGNVGWALKKSKLSSDVVKVVVLNPRTLSEVLNSILEIGDAVGTQVAARSLVDRLRSRMRAIARMVAGEKRVRVLSLEGLYPLVVGGHWLPEMKTLAGGIDGLQEPGAPAERLQWERVIAYAPEVIVICPCSSSLQRTLGELELIASLKYFWSIPAVESGRVFVCDHVYFSRPGPRLMDGIEIMARLLHPSKIHRKAPANTVLKLSLAPGQRCKPEELHLYFKPYH